MARSPYFSQEVECINKQWHLFRSVEHTELTIDALFGPDRQFAWTSRDEGLRDEADLGPPAFREPCIAGSRDGDPSDFLA